MTKVTSCKHHAKFAGMTLTKHHYTDLTFFLSVCDVRCTGSHSTRDKIISLGSASLELDVRSGRY